MHKHIHTYEVHLFVHSMRHADVHVECHAKYHAVLDWTVLCYVWCNAMQCHLHGLALFRLARVCSSALCSQLGLYRPTNSNRDHDHNNDNDDDDDSSNSNNNNNHHNHKQNHDDNKKEQC